MADTILNIGVGDSIVAKLAGAVATNQPEFIAGWVETYTNLPDRTIGVTNNTTEVTLVATPTAGFRQVDSITIYNADTAPVTITVQMANGATRRTLFVGVVAPGATVFPLMANTASWIPTILTDAHGGQEIHSFISETITLNTGGTTTDSTANLLPANSILDGTIARVVTTITTATDWELGDATTAGRFSAPNATLVAGTTQVGTVHMDQTGAAGPRQVAAAKMRITTTGAPGAGAIEVTQFYRQYIPQTS